MKLLLIFNSIIFYFISTIRNYLFDWKILRTYQSSLPVICVGNLTAGGNGKTPFCIYLAKMFSDYNPVILSRGYGSNAKKVTVVNDSHTAEEVGDEAKMMFDSGFSVVISPSRVNGAKWIEQNELGKLIILDDGFQHRYLNRDINFVLIDCSSKKSIFNFKKGYLLPYGRFREPKKVGLKRADAVILSSRSKSEVIIKNSSLGIPEHLPQFNSKISKTKIFPNINNSSKFVAVCAIANPNGFFKLLKELNLNIVEKYVMRDHYHFKKADIDDIKSKHPNCEIICTEKDAVKLRHFINVFSVQIEIEISPKIEFDNFVKNKLGSKI